MIHTQRVRLGGGCALEYDSYARTITSTPRADTNPSISHEPVCKRSKSFHDRLIKEAASLIFKELLSGMHMDGLVALEKVLDQPFWKRVWIYQEIRLVQSAGSMLWSFTYQFEIHADGFGRASIC